jgi:hypothetical protein
MQLTRQDVQIIEKVVETPKGFFLARFAVVQIAGEFKWKLLDMVALASDTAKSISNTILRLVAPKIAQITNFKQPQSKEVVSPYINFDFFVSQPTRAPNR